MSKYGFGRIPRVVLDLIVVKFLFQYLTKPIAAQALKAALAKIGA